MNMCVVCCFFFIFKKFVFLTLHMSKKQTVKTNQDVGETKVKYTQWQMNRVLAQVCEPCAPRVAEELPGVTVGRGDCVLTTHCEAGGKNGV